MVAEFPQSQESKESVLNEMDELRTLIARIRELRNQHNIGNTQLLTLYSEATHIASEAGLVALLKKLAQLEDFIVGGTPPDQAFSILAGKHTYLLDLPVERDIYQHRFTRRRVSAVLDYRPFGPGCSDQISSCDCALVGL